MLKQSYRNLVAPLLAAATLLGRAVLAHAAEGSPAATNRFGFAGKEIFPIENSVGLLHSADLDGDGLPDLVLVNNARSRINLLYNQTGKTNPVVALKNPGRSDPNELPPDSRFRIDSVASEKRISSLVVDDLNGDGRPDLAYYGEPKELVVLYNQGTNGWSAPRRWNVVDGMLNQNALVSGDINGDRLTDLLLLAENFIYVFSQNEAHALGEPEKIPYSGTVLALQVLDIQGDGRDDLMLVNWDSANPFRFRLQDKTGQLGPEIHFPSPPIRSYWADDLDHDGKAEIITIAQKSGRAQISNFTHRPGEAISGAWKEGQFQVLPLTKSGKPRRGRLWADLNGDARQDLIVTEPDGGLLQVYLQSADGNLGPALSFPTLTGVSELQAGDWDGDGQAELFLLSTEERQIGLARMDAKGRVGFPTLVPTEGRPLSMALGSLGPQAKGLVLAVVADRDGRRELQIAQADGRLRKVKLSDSFKSNPSSIVFADANQDGLVDLVILIPYEKVKVLLQNSEGEFTEVDATAPGGAAEQPWMGLADVDGDGKAESLFAQRNFLRAVVLKQEVRAGQTNQPGWAFQVKEQINGASANSRLMGAAALVNGTNQVASLVLLDAEKKSLTVCERNAAGVWQVARNLTIPVSEFSGIQAVALGGDKPNSISLLGDNSVGWISFGGEVWELTELDGYETPIKDAFLHDVISGDLNNDGRQDLVFMETSKGYLDVVTFEKPHQLAPANRWPVFEERTFRNRQLGGAEPREALIIDVTNDHRNDLLILVHDRIILYPQE